MARADWMDLSVLLWKQFLVLDAIVMTRVLQRDSSEKSDEIRESDIQI
jgi:hypothetical protein